MNAALFDFGGTIDTDGVHWSEKFRECYERCGVDISGLNFGKAFVESDAELLLAKDISTATMYRTLELQVNAQFRILGFRNRAADARRVIDECYQDLTYTIAAAKAVLQRLKLSYDLGVVSNFYGNLDVVLDEFGLTKLIKVAIDSEVVGVRKPDPRIFRLALESLGADPKKTWVIGDSYERDIVPGKALGCSTIWLKGKS
jgi:putative hydrolase of the HAD superfamily